MRVSRCLAVLGAVALVVASVSPAGAAEPGVGTTNGSLRVLDLDAGDLLALDLLRDLGIANTDPDVDDPAAASASLAALDITSVAAGLDQSIEVVQVDSTGDEQRASEGVTPVDNPVLGGSILPIDLSALVGDQGALSNIGAGIAELDVLSGILSVDATELGLEASAVSAQAAGTRNLGLDAVSILDLDELLAGLGIDLGDLPLESVLALVDQLGLLGELGTALADLGVDLDLENLSVESIQDAFDEIGTVITGLAETGEDLCDEVVEDTGGLLDTANELLNTDVCAALADSITELETLLGDALATTLSLLEGTALVSLDGLQVEMITEATDALDTSVADVTATLAGLRVGSLEIPSADLAGAVESVESQLDSILSTIDPALAGLIDIGLLEEETEVAESGDSIVSTASFTGLRVQVADLTDAVLGDLLSGVAEGESLSEELESLGLESPPELPVAGLTEINELLSQSGDPVTALSDGLTLRVGALDQRSSFTEVLSNTAAPPAPETPAAPELPQTGSNDTLILLGAAVAAAGALGVRRLVRITR